MDDASASFCFGPAEGEVHVVEEPGKEFDRVGLVEEVEFLVGLSRDLLQEFVGRDVRLEGASVPYLADQHREAGGELGGGGGAGGEVFEHEEVAKGRDMSKRLDDGVEVIIRLDVVHADKARAVLFA